MKEISITIRFYIRYLKINMSINNFRQIILFKITHILLSKDIDKFRDFFLYNVKRINYYCGSHKYLNSVQMIKTNSANFICL